MGLLKRLFGQKNQAEEASSVSEAPAPRRVRKSATEMQRAREIAPIWIKPGDAASIQGFDLLDGMIYIGSASQQPHPSMIDPSLPIDLRRSDNRGEHLTYWPAYSTIPPSSRTAYLDWMSTGRRRPSTPIGFVFIFFYGLERRVIADIAVDPNLIGELGAIRSELVDLLGVYGPTSASFVGYARDLIDYIDFRLFLNNPLHVFPAPKLDAIKEAAPIPLQAELARIAAAGISLPADRALAWAWYLPETSLRTPAVRCKREFIQLFIKRYEEQFPSGLTLTPGRARLAISYTAAAIDLGPVELHHPTLRAVFGLAGPTRSLATLFTRVTEELDPYSRWLGRNAKATESLAAAALLPSDLLPTTNRSFRKLRNWATKTLGANSTVLTSANPLIELWNPSAPGKLPRSESIQLANLLGRLNVGIEPDPRFGGPSLEPEQSIVLFRNESDAPDLSSPEYAAAATLVHLAAAVSQADGDVTDHEIEVLGTHLEHSLRLSPAERVRLHAHLGWLGTTEVKLTGLKKRFALIDLAARQSIGDMLVTVASADGIVSPAEVATLSRIYGLLSLDPSTVTSHLHGAITSSRSASGRGPVIVRPAGPREAGIAIPPPPAIAARNISPAAPRFVLDAASIQRKLAETAAVSALLGNIFVDDESAPSVHIVKPAVASSTVRSVGNLDHRHSAMFHILITRSEWARHEFDALAEQNTLMPNGAIDHLNESAYDIAGEPLLEGDDPITINAYAREEMSA